MGPVRSAPSRGGEAASTGGHHANAGILRMPAFHVCERTERLFRSRARRDAVPVDRNGS